jgi:SAM-dependent methyltransferase
MGKKHCSDGLPYEDQSHLRAEIHNPWRKLLSWYADQTYNGGMRALNRAVCEHLECNPSATVLDVGTGDGELFLYWSQSIGTGHLYALDAISNQHADRIQTTLANLDGEWPFPDARFDVVISSMNIEHIVDTPLYLHECFRALKDGGYAVILTENLASWANIFATMMGWMPFSLTNMFGYPIGNQLIWHNDLPKEDLSMFYGKKLWGCLGHQRLFTPLALRQLGERHGFVCEAQWGKGYLPFWGIMSHCMFRMDTRHPHFIGIKLRKPKA